MLLKINHIAIRTSMTHQIVEGETGESFKLCHKANRELSTAELTTN
jgi:hypothetical protein